MIKVLRKLPLLLFLMLKDCRWDFPIPPKKASRMLFPSFWTTFFYLYQRRKLETLSSETDIKKFWIKNPHSQPPTYVDWLRTAFVKQAQVFISNRMFDKMLDSKPKRILEGGCGSGATAACFLSFCEGKIDYELEYTGVDLSKVRVASAKKFVPKLSGGLSYPVKDSFEVGDLTNLTYETKFFDTTLVPSVLERVDNTQIYALIEEICRVTDRYIFISDFYDQYPMGWPRSPQTLNKTFELFGFYLVDEDYVYTNVPRNYCEIHLLYERRAANDEQ